VRGILHSGRRSRKVPSLIVQSPKSNVPYNTYKVSIREHRTGVTGSVMSLPNNRSTAQVDFGHWTLDIRRFGTATPQSTSPESSLCR
jgi:hypothetical protein